MLKIKNIMVFFIIILAFMWGPLCFSTLAQCFNCYHTNCFSFVYGQASWCGNNVQAGDEIGAFVSDVVINDGCVGKFVVATSDGVYGAMNIYGDDATTPEKDGLVDGDTITFKIFRNGLILDCQESIIWDVEDINNFSELNLSTGALVADFSATSTSGCAPFTVQFTNNPMNADSFLWDFGDNESGAGENPTHIYTSPGVYAVTLIAANACGNTIETKPAYITVNDVPAADFSAASTEGCAPLTVQFSNNSTNAVSYSWSFGDDSTSTEERPAHEYTAAGSYTVTLTVVNECGNKDETKIDYITVNGKPEADFTAIPTGGCAPLTTQFNNTSTGATGYSWDFGDGETSAEQNPSHTYAAAGDYAVIMTAGNECGQDSKMTMIGVQPFCHTLTEQSLFVWGNVVINGVGLDIGSWVGAFIEDVDINNGCVGTWQITAVGNYGAMAIYGDDPTTPEKDGAAGGDAIAFKAWQISEGQYIDLFGIGPDAAVWTGANQTLNINLSNSYQQEIPLAEGWNLISFQINKCYYETILPSVFIPAGVVEENVGSLMAWLLDDGNSPIRDITDPNKAGDWQRITSFDDGGAHILDKDLPSFINTLKYLSVGYGYWIKMNSPGVLILEGPFVPLNTSLELRDGWNLIGYIPLHVSYGDIAQEFVCPYANGEYKIEENIYYCPADPLPSLVFASIFGKFRRITSFDNCNGAMIFDTLLPTFINTLHYLGPKYGYWIKIEDPAGAVLVFPENCF